MSEYHPVLTSPQSPVDHRQKPSVKDSNEKAFISQLL